MARGFLEFLKQTSAQQILEVKSIDEKLEMLGLEFMVEHETYQKIPKTNYSARIDKCNKNTGTQEHAHIFAKPNGGGEQLFAINKDGSAHDRSHGAEIPKKVGKFLLGLDYKIPDNFVLEHLSLEAALSDDYILIIVKGFEAIDS